jgi:hypothetical protein
VQRSPNECVYVCVIVCGLETSTIQWPTPELGCWGAGKRGGEGRKVFLKCIFSKIFL